MDSDLSHILEQALQYASPLPVEPQLVDLNDAENVHQRVTVVHEPIYHDTMTSLVAAKNDLLTLEDGIHRFVEETEISDSFSGGIERKTCPAVHISSEHVQSLISHLEDVSPQTCLSLSANSNSTMTNSFAGEHSTDHHLANAMNLINEDTSDSKYEEELNLLHLQTVQEAESVISSIPKPTDLQPKIKRKRNRAKNPDPPPEAVLPPCKICDDKSSGYHYGTNTCEPCKAFFRRTLKKKEVDYQCKCQPGEQEKWKQGPYKNGCPACRYERCLMMGMSRNAIKIGRYTTNHKNKNIKEVKTLEAQEKILKDPETSLSNGEQSKSTVETVIIEHQSSNLSEPVAGTSYGVELQKDMEGRSLLEIAFLQALNDVSPASMISSSMSSSSGEKTSCQPSPAEFSQNSNSSFTSLQSKDVDFDSAQSPSVPQMTPSAPASAVPHYLRMGITLKEIDTIVKTLTEAHRTTQIIDTIPIEKVRQRQAEYLEKYHLKTQLFGEMRAISRAEFKEFYKATGIDIDGRNEEIEQALNFFQKRIAFLVAFAKSIPGFRELSLDGQASLIKASRVESAIMSSYRQMHLNFDRNNQILTTLWGRVFHLKEIVGVFPSDKIFARIRFADKLNALGLTYQEEAVIRALLTVAPDRCELPDQEKCGALQEKFFVCLQHLLTVRHGGPGRMLLKIMDIITDFRNLSEAELNVLQTEPLIKPHIMNEKYSLLREFLT